MQQFAKLISINDGKVNQMSRMESSPEELGTIDYMGMVDREVATAYLEKIRRFSDEALLGTLVPHAHLDPSDPAGYIISKHQGDASEESDQVRTTYDLGVVFGRSILSNALPDGEAGIPLVDSVFGGQEENADLKHVIDRMLNNNRHMSVAHLIKHDLQSSPELYKALEAFAKYCYANLPDKMYDGDEELARGCIDFFKVVSLLEAPASEIKASKIGRAIFTGFGRSRSSRAPRNVA